MTGTSLSRSAKSFCPGKVLTGSLCIGCSADRQPTSLELDINEDSRARMLASPICTRVDKPEVYFGDEIGFERAL